ncbi:MAG: M20/M25/M40 family metallo-hydrolase [Paracoccaceae bacterium]
MINTLRASIEEFCLTPGLSGHEHRIRKVIETHLAPLSCDTDRLGNLWTTFEGDEDAPTVLLFAHMDQLGFVVRKIEDNGFMRLEPVGRVPERVLPSQAVIFCTKNGDIPGVIGHRSRHETGVDGDYSVTRFNDLFVDAGFTSNLSAGAAGITIGTPVVYRPEFMRMQGARVAGTAIDGRACCAALVALAERLTHRDSGPTIHLAFTTQDQMNLRGVLPLVNWLTPDIAIQVDQMLSSDIPGMQDVGDMHLGKGPAMSLYSFEKSGTMNGVIPHPALVDLFEASAKAVRTNLQRSAQPGQLTGSSFVQFQGDGVACLDIGFPMRYSHSSLEVCDLDDIASLIEVLNAALMRIDRSFNITSGR